MKKHEQLVYEMNEFNYAQEFIEALIITSIYLKKTATSLIKKDVANDYARLFDKDIVAIGKDIAIKNDLSLDYYDEVGFIKLFAFSLMNDVEDGKEDFFIKKSKKTKPVLSIYDVRYEFWLKEKNTNQNYVVVLEREKDKKWRITDLYRFKELSELNKDQRSMFEKTFLTTSQARAEFIKDEDSNKSFGIMIAIGVVMLAIAVYIANS